LGEVRLAHAAKGGAGWRPCRGDGGLTVADEKLSDDCVGVPLPLAWPSKRGHAVALLLRELWVRARARARVRVRVRVR
jgi:hypothetical protein